MSSVGNTANAFAIYPFEIVGVDGDGEIIDRRSGCATYLRASLGAEVTLDMVSIPGGTFMMGDARHHQDEQLLHQVTVSPFYMGKYPITQAQYRSIMGDNAGLGVDADYPIEKISWHDAIEFCTKLSQLTGKTYTLPTEAQWEYACRAGTNTAFHFGNTITPDLANYNGDFPYGGAPRGENRERTTPVGIFPPNAFGLYDMHGNVWEWCLDVYQPSYQGAPTDGSAVAASVADDPKRVMRGGAWDYVAKGCRSSVRGSLGAGIRMAGCGLRVVVNPPIKIGANDAKSAFAD